MRETHFKTGGITNLGDYIRVVPDAKGPPAGYVELWKSAKLSWSESDVSFVVKPENFVAVYEGPKSFIVNITTAWLSIDVMVAHGPHSWHKTAEEDAADVAKAYWKIASNRRQAHNKPVFLLADANIELGAQHSAWEGIGQHQFCRTPLPYAAIFADLVEKKTVVLTMHLRSLASWTASHFQRRNCRQQAYRLRWHSSRVGSSSPQQQSSSTARVQSLVYKGRPLLELGHHKGHSDKSKASATYSQVRQAMAFVQRASQLASSNQQLSFTSLRTMGGMRTQARARLSTTHQRAHSSPPAKGNPQKAVQQRDNRRTTATQS